VDANIDVIDVFKALVTYRCSTSQHRCFPFSISIPGGCLRCLRFNVFRWSYDEF